MSEYISETMRKKAEEIRIARGIFSRKISETINNRIYGNLAGRKIAAGDGASFVSISNEYNISN